MESMVDVWNDVKELIPDNVEKEKLFDALRRYQSSQDLSALLADMHVVLNEPNKLELYDFMRPLILLRHQIEYSKRSPPVPGVKLRTIRLLRNPAESLGFTVRGGYEHGVGVFVTQVTPGSQADRQGLRPGDEVVRVNGFTISEAIHDDVLNLIKSRDEIILKVTYIGMLPIKDDPAGPVTWQYVNPIPENEDEVDGKRGPPQDIKIFIDSTGHASIGCSILSESGPAARFPGIYVEKVRPGSIGEEVGLEPGDQILEVNEISFRNITWKEAVLALKSSRQLNILIRKKAGSMLVQRLSASLSQHSANAGETSNRNSSSSAIEMYATPSPVTEPKSDDSEPIYSTVNKVSSKPSPDSAERRSNWQFRDIQLDEAELINQQLDMKPLFQKPPPLPPSPALSTQSASSSVISTAAEVHISSANDGSLSNVPDSSLSYESSSSHSQASILGGAAAMRAERQLHSASGNRASLLGPQGEFDWTEHVPAHVYAMIDPDILDGRLLKCLTYRKNCDLGIEVEGGLGSPLGGKILVAVIFDGGIAQQSGKMHVGDHLMMINGQLLLGVTCAEAEKIMQAAENAAKDTVELYYCESSLVNDEDSVTYF